MRAATISTMEDTGPVEVDGPSQRRRWLGLRNSQRKVDIIEARDWAMRVSLKNQKHKFWVWEGLSNGTLNPMLIRAIWEMTGVMPKGNKADNLADAVRGMTILLRKSLSVDPLAEAKPIGSGSTLEQPPQAELPPRASIVPPARPRRTQQGKGTLKPGEEELA